MDDEGAAHTRSLTITVAQATGLQSGTALSGLSGEAGSTRYYVLEVPSGATQLVISIAGGTGDATRRMQVSH
ncbi:MAG: hypothetical protein WD960_07460 [Gemmatimonadota bacterium]